MSTAICEELIPKPKIGKTNEYYLIKFKDSRSSLLISGSHDDNTISNLNNHSKTSRLGLIESLTNPSKRTIFNNKIEEITQILKELKYNNPNVLKAAIEIIRACISYLHKSNIIISKTSENELLIYRKVKNDFNNIIIDEDGDIEFLHIPDNRDETSNEYYPFDENINYLNIASKL